MSSRISSINWGTTGQLPASTTNALNQTTQYDYDFGLGLPTSVTDPNEIAISFQYDTFGRKTRENRPDGTATTWSFTNCSAGGCVNAANILAVTETVLNVGGSTQTDSFAYLDRSGRPLVTGSRLLNGSYNRNETQYDSLGRVLRQTAPCSWTSCTYYWSTFSYDALNRPTQTQRPVNEPNSSTLQTTTFQYAGRSTTTTDPQGKQSSTVTSVVGTLLRTQDHNGYYQNFVNDAFGSLLSVKDSLSNTLFSATYDYGVGAFQRTINDTDLGARSYTFNALGELVLYSDAKAQTFSISYDALSRPLTRTEPDLTTVFTWGSSAANRNIGQLESVSAGSYVEAFTYDGVGRQASRTITVPSDGSYTYDTTYSSVTGLPDTLTYPVTAAGNRLKLQYAYTDGILQSVSDFNSPGTVFWTANATNVAGQVTQETLGNGVVTNRTFDAVTGWMSSVKSGPSGGAALQNESYLYDLAGNVTQRQNNNLVLTENFYYDNLYRLEQSTLGGATNLELTYDATGNILSNSTLAGGASWTYGTSRKHAVTQAGSSANTYAYDANGNVINRNGHSISWTSYDHPSVINGPAGESVQFAYNHNHLRWRAIYTCSAGVETTYFVGELLEKVVTTGATDYRHFITVGGKTVAIFSRTGASAATVRYVVHDHQGSVAGILNADGTSYVKESFTAFGERRNQCTWSGRPTQGTKDKIAAVTRHGYTWHTALAEMGLNDMNGRIQDATTGRFLSPDPFVDPGKTQGFNRYSYVQNNPLTYTDPTGFQPICRMIIERDYAREAQFSNQVLGRRAQTAGDGGMYPEAVVRTSMPQFYTQVMNCIYIPDQPSTPSTPSSVPGVNDDGQKDESGERGSENDSPQGHEYLAKNPVCNRPLTTGEQRSLLRRFGIPNTYTTGRDQGGSGYHLVATALIPGGVVRSDFSPDGLSVRNTTTWFHAFVGTIDRSFENTSAGAFLVTHGYGNAGGGNVPNATQNLSMFQFWDVGTLRDGINEALGPYIFGAVDSQAQLYAAHHFDGC